MKLLLPIIIAVLILSIIYLVFHCVKETYTTSNSNVTDKYIALWDSKIFTPNYDVNVNYVITYHYRPLKVADNSVNIVLDGEPADLSGVKADAIITTKKAKLPLGVPNIYVPYFVWSFIEKNNDPKGLIKAPNENVKKTKFCCFMYGNCDEKMDGVKARKEFYYLLNQKSGGRVDNLGKCYNSNFKNNGNWTKSNDIYMPYKFVISFENNQIPGYISEKLVMPMLSRSIPIYFGPDISEFFNKKSVICVNDFPDFNSCIDYVLKVDSDDNLYRSILAEPYLVNNQVDKTVFSAYYGGRFYQDLYNILSMHNLRDFIRPCQFFPNNVMFITFADENVYKSERIMKEAQYSRFFKQHKVYSPKDFDQEFLKRHEAFIKNNTRGYGYWLWKPWILKKALEKLENDDYLVYADSGTTISPDGSKKIKEYYTLLQNNDIISFRIQYPEKSYMKMDCAKNVLKYFNLDNQETLSFIFNEKPEQNTTGIWLVKKTPNVEAFAKAWYELACDHHNIDDSPSLLPNDPSFKEHRHDQSIFSPLTKLFPKCVIVNDNYSDDKQVFTTPDGQPLPFILTRKRS